MGQSKQPECNPKELKNAQALWEKFTTWSKWATIAIAITLIIMALTLV
ncbi:MAG: aa3-type cytochrome c oxidase subunit IV [Pseudomonadota bacterium]